MARKGSDDCRDEARALLAALDAAGYDATLAGPAGAALIAAAPTLLAALCDELDARDAQVARLREALTAERIE